MSLLRANDGKAHFTLPTGSCKVCGKGFIQWNTMAAVVCSLKCAQRLPVIARNTLKAQAKSERAQTKAREKALKTRGDWLKDAKTEMQRMRRLEELHAGHGCMSCGRSQQEVMGTDAWKPGGAWDGGHFLSKGAAPELALEPLNIWLQCKSCNAGSGKYARKAGTVSKSFRLNLIERIGLEKVEWLEGPHEPAKWTIEELEAVIANCRARTRAVIARERGN